jgi:hypothetical protein
MKIIKTLYLKRRGAPKKSLLLFAFTILTFIGFRFYQNRDKYFLYERTQDLILLRNVCNKIAPSGGELSVTIDELIKIINSNGKKLNSPLAIHKNKPCYQINSHASSIDDILIAENENVKKTPYHGRVYVDGCIELATDPNTKRQRVGMSR